MFLPHRAYAYNIPVQSLMLLSMYQQNSQRSTESLTTHALAVKTSYHLGIHATFLYEFVSVREKEIRARLWFAVVNQDRMLSSALGQPCLIPLQHVRDDIGDFLDATGQNRTVEMSYSRENLTYFRNITWVSPVPMSTSLLTRLQLTTRNHGRCLGFHLRLEY